jgi:hypothetical protein
MLLPACVAYVTYVNSILRIFLTTVQLCRQPLTSSCPARNGPTVCCRCVRAVSRSCRRSTQQLSVALHALLYMYYMYFMCWLVCRRCLQAVSRSCRRFAYFTCNCQQRHIVCYTCAGLIGVPQVSAGSEQQLQEIHHRLPVAPHALLYMCWPDCTQYTAPIMQTKKATSPGPCIQGWACTQSSLHPL